MKKSIFWGALAVIMCIVIYLFTQSPESTGSNTFSIIEKVTGLGKQQADLLNVIIRKLTHITVFGLLAFFITMAFLKNPYFNAWMLTTIYAATDEYHQSFMPGRTSSYYDVLLDSCAALAVVLIVRSVRTIKKKK